MCLGLGFVFDEEGQVVVLGWVTSNGGARCVAAVRLGFGEHGRFLRPVRCEGMVLRSCSAGFWMSWPFPTSTAMWRHSSSFKFDVLLDGKFVQFVILYGLFLDVVAKSYVECELKAMVFDRVRLVSGHDAQVLRRRHQEGTGLRCSTARSEDWLGDD